MIEKAVYDYLTKKAWDIRENANINYSWSALLFNVSGKIIANYTLDKVYPKRISDAHRKAQFHIHDLGFGLTGYCAGWNLRKLLLEGFGDVPGKTSSKPAKHLDTALLQMINFFGTLQNEWAGAQAFNSMDTLLAPFIREDRLTYKQVKQAMQKLIFNCNITSRWGAQSPFTNITLDWTIPKDLENQRAILGGKFLNKKYADFQKEVDMINRAFLEVMLEGDANQRPFTFPIPTYNLTKNFDWDGPNIDLLFKMTAKYGSPYFANFVTSDLDPRDIRSMCCRLRLDLRKLHRNITGGLFASGDETGSVGVVTINMPQLAYLSKNEGEFFQRLNKLMNLAAESLEIRRKVVEENMKRGLLPFTKRYLGTLNWHFSTIGLIGMNEACLNLFGKDISNPESKKFAIKVLNFMRSKFPEFQKKTGHVFNLEATPAEGATYRLAHIDKKQYPKIITAGTKEPYYTNSTWLPVNKTSDVVAAINHQEDLQSLYTGGTVFHTFLGEKISAASAKNFIKKVMYNTKLPYLTLTPTYSICPSHGFIEGEHKRCPKCGKIAEVYSRVVGFFRPVAFWNDSKQEEFRQRRTYEIK